MSAASPDLDSSTSGQGAGSSFLAQVDKQLSECAMCGACTAVCPVYQVTGRESLTARGRLHLLKTLSGADADAELAEILSKCLLCGACRAACPRGIDIPAIITLARASRPQVTGFSSFKKYLAQQALARPGLLAVLTKAARPFGLLPETLPPESGLRLALTAPLLDLDPPVTAVMPQAMGPSPPAAQALYFSGCLAQHLAPSIGVAAEVLLARLCAYQLLVPEQQGCCGLAAKAAGDLEQARSLARRTITLFSGEEVWALPVFTTCASCYASLKAYPDLLANDPLWRGQAQAFAARVWEFSSFILQHASPAAAAGFRRDLPVRPIVYHDPCHLRFAKITDPPRELLRQAPGLNCLELPHGPRCCGQGGLFHIAHAELSRRIVKPLVDDFLSSGATTVVTSCSGCLLQWQQSLAAAGSKARATHLALILAQQLASRELD